MIQCAIILNVFAVVATIVALHVKAEKTCNTISKADIAIDPMWCTNIAVLRIMVLLSQV